MEVIKCGQAGKKKRRKKIGCVRCLSQTASLDGTGLFRFCPSLLSCSSSLLPSLTITIPLLVTCFRHREAGILGFSQLIGTKISPTRVYYCMTSAVRVGTSPAALRNSLSPSACTKPRKRNRLRPSQPCVTSLAQYRPPSIPIDSIRQLFE